MRDCHHSWRYQLRHFDQLKDCQGIVLRWHCSSPACHDFCSVLCLVSSFLVCVYYLMNVFASNRPCSCVLFLRAWHSLDMINAWTTFSAILWVRMPLILVMLHKWKKAATETCLICAIKDKSWLKTHFKDPHGRTTGQSNAIQYNHMVWKWITDGFWTEDNDFSFVWVQNQTCQTGHPDFYMSKTSMQLE